MIVRGIRGATTVTKNLASDIHEATQELLQAIQAQNPGMQSEDIASVLFTMTPDLNAAFPAKAARQIGWTNAPLICAQEIPVPGGLPNCIRVLLQWNTDRHQDEICHVYLREAVKLRPDIASQNSTGASHD